MEPLILGPSEALEILRVGEILDAGEAEDLEEPRRDRVEEGAPGLVAAPRDLQEPPLEQRAEGVSALDALFMILRAGYCILPYFLLAFCLTVVGRSTALGVAGILLYLIVESIIVAILGGLGGPAPTIRAFTLGHNVSAVLAANNIGGGAYNTMAFRDTPIASELPNPWMGAFAVAVYCAAFLTITFSIFQKRDMTAGAGAS